MLIPNHTTALVLLLKGPPAHRYRHSFPTRRSSDLGSIAWIPIEGTPGPGGGAGISSEGKYEIKRGLRPGKYRVRSEEHTSELQSPCNLVCRLLLEKKKQKVSKVEHQTQRQIRR